MMLKKTKTKIEKKRKKIIYWIERERAMRYVFSTKSYYNKTLIRKKIMGGGRGLKYQSPPFTSRP